MPLPSVAGRAIPKALLGLLLLASGCAGPVQGPPTPVDKVTDSYFGTAVTDP